MADREMLTVYCYDIARPRTRARVAALMEAQAVRVQDSVFEVRLTRSAADQLYDRVAELIDPGDLLRMYAISAAGFERCRSQGAPIAEDGDFWIV